MLALAWSETSPFSLEPQHLTVSSAEEIAQHVSHAQVRPIMPSAVVVVGTESWLFVFAPQHMSAPEEVCTAHLQRVRETRQREGESGAATREAVSSSGAWRTCGGCRR